MYWQELLTSTKICWPLTYSLVFRNPIAVKNGKRLKPQILQTFLKYISLVEAMYTTLSQSKNIAIMSSFLTFDCMTQH